MTERFPQPPPGHRDWYAFEALRALPRILLMIDRNPLSRTYGCCDREFWHYKTVDFPCAMNQEFCLPLALAFACDFPHNPYRGLTRLRDLVEGILEYAAKTTRPDGSCDDYFPFEKALGANVFTTYAMAESYRILKLTREDLLECLRRRADWLCANNESGQLANHQAFAALALYTVFEVTGVERYREASNRFRDIILSWQNQEEGWFQEYEGADPGYHSCSIAFLAKLYQKSGDASLIEPLKRAVEFAAHFMHPDGSYAGEYGSRNTYHFYPHGFEVLSSTSATAGRIAETYLQRAMPERRRYFNDDNRMCAHYVYDWMQAWLDYNPVRQGMLDESRGPFTTWLPHARLFIKKTGSYYAVASLAKGGVIKVFDAAGPLQSDTGPMLRTTDGHVLVSHLVDEWHVEVDESAGRIVTSGPMSFRRSQLPSPVKQIIFRAMNLTLGRFNPHLVRRMLQKVLITGKPRSAVILRRTLEFTSGNVAITDEIDARGCDYSFDRLMVGTDATSIYVANSTNYQESVLLPWQDLHEYLPALNAQRMVHLPSRLARAS
jgi:hypothetical protein